MLCSARHERILLASDQLLSVPQVQRSVFHGAGNDTPRVVVGWEAPCYIVESVFRVSVPNRFSKNTRDEYLCGCVPGLGGDAGYRLQFQALILVVQAQVP